MSPTDTLRPGVDSILDAGVAQQVPETEKSRSAGKSPASPFRWSPETEYRFKAPVAAVSFSLDPPTVVRVLGAVVIPVFAIGFLVALVAAFAGFDTFPGGAADLLGMLDLGRAPNLASWFACLCFFGSAAALALLAALASSAGDPLASDWRRLSWLFLLISVDQVCALHETVLTAVHRLHPFTRDVDFLWVIIAANIVFSYFRPFMSCLPPPIRNRFALAAIIYFFGALGMEFAGAAPASAHVHGAWEFSTLFDRVLQMTGLLLFMRALVDHLTDYAPRFGVRLDRRK